MKKIKIFPLILIICLALSCAAPGAFAEQAPEVGAGSAVLADLNSGTIIFSQNMNAKVAPASLTKIMTVLLAVEAIENGTDPMSIVTAQGDCRQGLDDDSSTVNITPGEQLTLEDLLYCAMVHSANESCNVIGEYISGSIAGFVDRMNSRAVELGCTGTHFSNTNGLPSDSHYSTAYDIYLIAAEAVKHPMFMTICNTSSYTVSKTNYAPERVLYNSNALISSGSIYGSGYTYEYAAGVKTGYTRAAGNCLVSTAKKGDLNLIAVVMGCDGPNKNPNATEYGNFVDTIALYEWALNSFEYRTIVTTADVIRTAAVELAAGDEHVSLRPQEDITALVPSDFSSEDVKMDVTIYDEKLVAPIASGTILGEARVFVNGNDCGKINLISANTIELSRLQFFKLKVQAVFEKTIVRVVLIILAIFAAIYIALVLRYRSLRRKHLKAKRAAEQRRRATEQTRREARMQHYSAEAPDDSTRRFAKIDPSVRDDAVQPRRGAHSAPEKETDR